MRNLCSHIRQYFSWLANKTQTMLLKIVVALSFLALIASFGFMLYFLFVEFDLVRVVASAIAIYTFIYLNKSLQGR